jgi:hypothetical protein
MNEHRVLIVPLNSGLGGPSSPTVTFARSEHDESRTGSVLCTGPMESYFRLKSGASAPSIESAFFGIRPGDEMLVELEAMLVRGTADTLRLDFLAISGGKVDDLGASQVLPPGALATHFTWFRVPYLVRGRAGQGEGVVLRIGFDDPEAEVAIRRVVVRVRSTNPTLALRNRIVALSSRADFAKNLSLIQRSPIQPAFHGARGLLREGAITFPDPGTAAIAWPSGSEQWAGFVAYLPACSYPQPVHVYYEVCDPPGANRSPGEGVGPVGDDLAEPGPRARTENLPTEGAWVARSRTFPGIPGPKRLIRVDVGGEFAATRTQIRNVHFSLPRFDDVLDHRRPNELDEIYPDLSAVLSP